MQCDRNQCWCVNRQTGVAVLGTHTNSPSARPDCASELCNTRTINLTFIPGPRTCPFTCSQFAGACPLGVRLDASGCPFNNQCQCRDVCEVCIVYVSIISLSITGCDVSTSERSVCT